MVPARDTGLRGEKAGKHNESTENLPDSPWDARPVGCGRILSKTQGVARCIS